LRRPARRYHHLTQLARREPALGEHRGRAAERRVRELGGQVLRQAAAHAPLDQALGEQVDERGPAAGERGHGVEQVLAGDRDRLTHGLEELQGVLQIRRRGLGAGHRHRDAAGADEADFLHEPSPPPEEPGRLAPGPRPAKSARPSRRNVAPSSTATGKSSLIPIERWGSSTPRRVWARFRSSRSTRKWGREASGRAGAGGIAIRPSRRSPGWPRIASATTSTRSGGTPRLVPSPPTFTWTRTASERPARPTSAARAAARGAESTVCTRSKRPTAARTLLRWRPPIRCQDAAPATAARLASASCT